MNLRSTAFLAFSASAALAAGNFIGSAPLVVSNVAVTRDTASHALRVSYDLANENDEPAYITLDVQTNGVSIGWDKFRTLSGDVTKSAAPHPIACGTGRALTWNAPADWSGNLGDNATVVVSAHYTNAIGRIPGVYLKIDVSGGAGAASYPVTYSFVGPDMTDAAKPWAKDFIWLRCLGTGSFQMGSPAGGETGRQSNEVLHGVTFSKPFYVGVFEVTEYQYRQVMGALPPGLTTAKGDAKCVTQCSYNLLRGTAHSWPTSSDVGADTFLGRLRAKTGLAFDLPTEAQWEYACRAGVQAALHNGKAATANAEASSHWLRYIAWFTGNRGGSAGPAEVGSKAPNNWLLYDMTGNGYELVLDWYAADVSAYSLDPVGPATGTQRILRGGAYDADYNWCRSAFRLGWNPASTHQALGFRLALGLD